MSYLPSIPFPNGAAASSPSGWTVRPARQAEPGAEARAELMAIVTCAQAGDLGAQSALVRRYSARIAGFVRPIIAQPNAVEDVVQMVFIKMVRRLGLLRDPGTFESWLFALARNTAFDFIRRRRCRPTMVSDNDHLVEMPYVDSSRAMREIMEALEVVLTRLSPKDRNLVTLIVQGSSYRAAAQREGLSLGAVKLRLNRVRPFLRESISEAIGLRSKASESFRPSLRSRIAA